MLVIFGCAFVVKLPATVVKYPPVAPILPILALPVIVTTLLDLLNVNAVTELALPASLNTTPVLAPGITILPEILPTTLPIKFGAYTLPVKFAVLPDNSKLTVALAVVRLPAVIKLLPVMLPVAVIKPPVIRLAPVTFPVTDTEFDILLNVNAVLELALPASLNTTPVLDPGITILPEILPTTLPMKFGAVTFPVKFAVLPDNCKLIVVLALVILPVTAKLVSVPTLVIFG